MTTPLLIGGATTSRIHTAVKIEPAYSSPVVHVADASRAVAVAGALLDKRRPRTPTRARMRAEYEQVRIEREGRRDRERGSPLADARANRSRSSTGRRRRRRPSFLGVRAFDGYPLAELVERIDWTPFFATWELRGAYPAIFADPQGRHGGPRPARGRASRCSRRIVDERPAHARRRWSGSGRPTRRPTTTSILFEDEARDPRARPHPRDPPADGQARRAAERVDRRLRRAGRRRRPHRRVRRDRGHRDDRPRGARSRRRTTTTRAILARALADRLAEAFAERLHERVRRELWGYAADEALSNDDLIAERYQGIRPAPGYPATPDHSAKSTLFELLDAEARAGIELTESLAMLPAASVSGLYLWHPEQPLLRDRADRARPARGLRPARGDQRGRGRAPARRRTWRTTPRPEPRAVTRAVRREPARPAWAYIQRPMRAARPAIHARRAALVLFAMALAIGLLPGPVEAAPRHAYRENIAGPRDWVAQATFVQCVGASLQMMLNIVHPGTTHSRPDPAPAPGPRAGVERADAAGLRAPGREPARLGREPRDPSRRRLPGGRRRFPAAGDADRREGDPDVSAPRRTAGLGGTTRLGHDRLRGDRRPAARQEVRGHRRVHPRSAVPARVRRLGAEPEARRDRSPSDRSAASSSSAGRAGPWSHLPGGDWLRNRWVLVVPAGPIRPGID